MVVALPKDMSELLSVIDAEWKLLLQLAERLTPQQMEQTDAGGWSPKDNLAHLAEWMAYMRATYLNKVPAHEGMRIDAETFKTLDEAGINAVLWERNHSRPAPEVLAQLKSTYAEVLQTVQGMPFEALMQPLRPGSPDKRLVIESVLANTSEHFHEHRENIEKGLR